MAITGLGVYIILSNLKDNIVFFYPPSEVYKISYDDNKVRVGGIVKEGSIQKISGAKISFIITDNIAEMEIIFDGIVPALFREKQGIVAEGKLISEKSFLAKKLLAKHDENYMPPEIVNSIKK
jgi:cytochrome c-type biogenesis protein CcmE